MSVFCYIFFFIQDQELEKEKPFSDNTNTVYDIQIFTEEFLKFNKG